LSLSEKRKEFRFEQLITQPELVQYKPTLFNSFPFQLHSITPASLSLHQWNVKASVTEQRWLQFISWEHNISLSQRKTHI